MVEKSELPTAEERAIAFAAFERGEFDLMESYLRRALSWYLEASKPSFDRDRFIAGVRSRGQTPTEAQIQGASRLSEDLRAPFQESAAEHAFLLGKLLQLQCKNEEVRALLSQAAELAPKNTLYATELKKTEAENSSQQQ
jgi:hypothetical protein